MYRYCVERPLEITGMVMVLETRCMVLALLLASCSSQQTPTAALAPSREVVALPELERACAGTHLDLKWAGDSPECRAPYNGTWLDAPEGLEVFLEPSRLVLEAGASSEADYVLRNPTEEVVTFDLAALDCYTGDFEVQLFDAAGERADRTGVPCPGGGGCSAPNTRITLAPGGDARLRFEVKAMTREMQRCKLQEPTSLAAATYTLSITAGDSTEVLVPVSGTLDVIPGKP